MILSFCEIFVKFVNIVMIFISGYPIYKKYNAGEFVHT